MTARIQALWKQALHTFAGQRNSNCQPCQKNFDKLWYLMNRIIAEDVGLSKQILEGVKSQSAPMCGIDIFENKDLSISIFILKHGFTMPLHDHPGMHGFLKVLSGTVRVNSFTLKRSDAHIVSPNEEIAAVRHRPIILDSSSSACILTPHKKNLHEIVCIDGPCAFLDILSPPYDVDAFGKGPRPCTYFRIVSATLKPGSSDEIEDVQLLTLEGLPFDFRSTSLSYTGPPLI